MVDKEWRDNPFDDWPDDYDPDPPDTETSVGLLRALFRLECEHCGATGQWHVTYLPERTVVICTVCNRPFEGEES